MVPDMMDIDGRRTIRITCAIGLASYLEQEVNALGFRVQARRPTYVEIEGNQRDAMRLNLYLRTAFNVLEEIATFGCSDPESLYDAIHSLPWEDMIDPGEYLCVVASVKTPTISDHRFAALKVKDAIVDRIAARVGERPDAGPLRENFVVHLYWYGEDCQLFFNTSGRKLSDRNYRKLPHRAPMQETLAAGVLMATGYDGSQPLVNPMCGSGTLAIEAALLATGRPPGLLRSNFGLLHHKAFDAEAWKVLRLEARKVRRQEDVAPIIASDIDERAVAAARRNAETAGVHHLITFEVCDFAATPLPDAKGIVILNPEYGERLGRASELETTYKRIGDFFKQQCSGWTGYVFTGNMKLAKLVHLKASRRIEFYNAKIDCRLLRYDLYEGTRRATAG